MVSQIQALQNFMGNTPEEKEIKSHFFLHQFSLQWLKIGLDMGNFTEPLILWSFSLSDFLHYLFSLPSPFPSLLLSFSPSSPTPFLLRHSVTMLPGLAVNLGSYCLRPPEITSICHQTWRFSVVVCFFLLLCMSGVLTHVGVGAHACGSLRLVLGIILN